MAPRAAALRVSPSHVYWHVAVSVPDQQHVLEYAKWHWAQEFDDTDVVPLIVDSLESYLRAYGHDAVSKCMRSLQVSGRPLPTWVGVVHSKELDVRIKCKCERLDVIKCKYADPVANLKPFLGCCNGCGINCELFEIDLVYAGAVLQERGTLSEAGLTDGAELQVVVRRDPLPSSSWRDPLSSSDSE